MEFKPDGMILLTYHEDRGGGDSLTRLLFQGIRVWIHSFPEGEEREREELRVLPLKVECGNHDTHQPCMDSLDEACAIAQQPNAKLGKRCFKVLRSLRESAHDLFKTFVPWLMAHLEWTDIQEHYDDVFAFWMFLGLDVETSSRLAQMNVRWQNGELLVMREYQARPATLEQVLDCLYSAYKFDQFAANRWGHLGAPCRRVNACMNLGLDDVVHQTIANPDNSDWYICCYRELDAGARLTPLTSFNDCLLLYCYV